MAQTAHPLVPRSIGRYEIVGRLATGGMAEVFLGRLHGPYGFERPVVIKRILPHLALDRVVVAMFLDEARIIANLRHPNLVNVHELGREGEELFLAMELLEGESLSGLCRRLAREGEFLDYSLAAHVVAEACSGLHAAHEATSVDGRPLQIVHRDVSPQNIFVTYAGAVHVIDFGIATTVDRIGRTEAGTVRGKFEYIAPEQLESLPLDRRADVFALGVVLFELASGRRAYKRESPAQTMMAVLHEPVPSLSALRPDAPPQLEAICARAMAKNRRDRFQTAAEMRRELLTFARKHADGDLGEQLGSSMRRLFGDRIAEKAEMLQRVRQGSEVENLPAAEVDVDVDLPTAEQPPATVVTELSQSVVVRAGDERRRRWMVPVVALGSVAGLVATLALHRSRAPDRPPVAVTTADLAATSTNPPPASAASALVSPADSTSPGAFPSSSGAALPRPAVSAFSSSSAATRPAARTPQGPSHAVRAPVPAPSTKPIPTVW